MARMEDIERKAQSNQEAKTCLRCGRTKGIDSFPISHSLFYPNGRSPLCFDCLGEFLEQNGYDWNSIDKVCQYLDIPFNVGIYSDLIKSNGTKAFEVYCQLVGEEEYSDIDWSDYESQYKELEKIGLLDQEIPALAADQRRKLKVKWGPNYDDEELEYLEDFHNKLLLTQNVTGAVQEDQAKNLSKISLKLSSEIREGQDITDTLKAYDTMVKIGNFTPKNAKNANDFDSVGELVKWMEKRGFRAKFYDGVTRDIVDETMKSIQSNARRLYIGESGIGDEITKRIEALQSAASLENEDSIYGIGSDYDLDEYDVDSYDQLMKEEEFEVNLDEEDD